MHKESLTDRRRWPIKSNAHGLVFVDLAKVFNIGTFNLGTWIATVAMAALGNAIVEGLFLRFAFKLQFTKRVFGLLVVANMVSVAAAAASLLISPPVY